MFLAFVAAVGNVGLEDVAIAGFELFQDSRFVDDAGTAVIGECAEKNGVGLCFGQLDASAIWLARLNLMSVADIGPVLRFMERLELIQFL